MSLYSTYVLAQLLHHDMASPYFAPFQAELRQHARGRVLELGLGSGLNLPYYPSHLQELHAVEANAGMLALAYPLLAQSPLPVYAHLLNAENLRWSGINRQFEGLVKAQQVMVAVVQFSAARRLSCLLGQLISRRPLIPRRNRLVGGDCVPVCA